jgi:hypothetical protein
VAVEAALRQRAGGPDVRIEPADIAHLLALVRSEITPLAMRAGEAPG